MITRRGFNTSLLVLSTGGAVGLLELGCGKVTPATILTEIDNILTFVAPLGDGVASIIEIADPAIAPIVAAAVAIYDKAVPAIEALIASWAAASAAAQPGILAQIQAAIQSLQQDVQGIITSVTGVSATVLAEINSITAAILGEISALLKAVQSLVGAGGTMSAAIGMAQQPRKYAKLVGPTTKTRRDNLAAELAAPTGTNIDPALAALSAKLKGLELK
jgi:prophage DNA circulation protein